MKLKTGLIFVLSFILICVTLVSCKKEEEMPPLDDGTDEYTGSIAPEEENKGSGDGTPTEEQVDEGDANVTYEIFTADDLKNKLKIKGTYVLKANIDLEGAEWKPVGSKAHPFAGTFDGGGFKITNFKVTEKPAVSNGDISLAFKYAYSGFFGVTENATVKDVTFEGVNVDVSLNTENTFIFAGTVVGYAAEKTTFSGVTVASATVSAKSREHITYVGGLAGSMRKSNANNCSVNASLNAKESLNDAICGGITAESSESEFIRCNVYGSVVSVAKYGKAYSGGLIGYCSSSKISKCVSASSVSATVSSSSPQTGKKGSASAGGFAAIITASSSNKRTEISESYTADTCTVSAVGNKNAAYAGGFAASSEYGIYTHCYSRSSINAESSSDAVYAAGLIANLRIMNHNDYENATPYPYDTRLTGCFSTGNITVKIPTKAYFLGTLVYSDLEIKGEAFIFDCGYIESTIFKLNEDALQISDEKIKKNGNGVSAAVYVNLFSFLKDNYGYSADVWETKPGDTFPTLKPTA